MRLLPKAVTAAALLITLWSLPALAEEIIRVGVLKFGTVNWELTTIQRHGLDRKHGFTLEVLPLASDQATKVALQTGEVDMIVSDWLWVSRQRSEGKPYTFVPFSSSVGALMVPAGSDIHDLADLKGKKIAVAGGPLDKSWLLLRGLTQRRHGFDPAEASEPVFGAPPLLAKKAEQGEVDAVLNYWHYSARLEAKGFRRIIGANDAAMELGAKGPISAIGYVFDEPWAAGKTEAVRGFVAASREAKELLRSSDAEWEVLREMTGAKDDATLIALRDRFREGIPARPLSEEMADTAQVYDFLAELGGEKLVGKSKTMAPGTFWPVLVNGF
ncbi:MAG: ABC transporter substrate-binding protein [Kiloniellaceae bacterium]